MVSPSYSDTAETMTDLKAVALIADRLEECLTVIFGVHFPLHNACRAELRSFDLSP